MMEGTKISTTAQARSFLKKTQLVPTSADGSGTDIEAALLNFYDTVGKSSISSHPELKKVRLARANCVLITDGGSSVSEKKIMNARQQIPGDVELFLNFIGLGTKNPALIRLAESSAKSDQKALAYQITDAIAAELLAIIKPIDEDPNAFASTLQDGIAPTNFVFELQKLGDRQWYPVNFESTSGSAGVDELLQLVTSGASKVNGAFVNFKKVVSEFSLISSGIEKPILRKIACALVDAYRSGMPVQAVSPDERSTFEIISNWTR